MDDPEYRCRSKMCNLFSNDENAEYYPTGKQFRKWSLQNHPDKGGNSELFGEVSGCYSSNYLCPRTGLSSPQPIIPIKQEYSESTKPSEEIVTYKAYSPPKSNPSFYAEEQFRYRPSPTSSYFEASRRFNTSRTSEGFKPIRISTPKRLYPSRKPRKHISRKTKQLASSSSKKKHSKKKKSKAKPRSKTVRKSKKTKRRK